MKPVMKRGVIAAVVDAVADALGLAPTVDRSAPL